MSQTAPVPLPDSLAGKTVAFLDNTKPNFELLVREMEPLSDRQASRGGLRAEGELASAAAPEVLEAVAAAALVITGSAD